MGYFSCNAESAIAVCDPYNWDRHRRNNILHHKLRRFTYDELATATNGFSADSFLGKGSHGSVYKAVLDGGKLLAAVKRTTSPPPPAAGKCSSCNNSPADNEIEILSRVRNHRLVNLIGFCGDSEETATPATKMTTKLLVVEFMPNGSLYEILHLEAKPPGWSRRVRHALQIARAIDALHSADPPVIHRDVKSSNVLIDGGGKARLGDFGLALRGHVEDVRVKCTPPAGTMGYLDPSYLAPADLSAKSDVFSFGILLLEIISGRNAIDFNYSPPSIVDWAVPLIKRGDFAGICDPRIGTPPDTAAVRVMAVLAARCVRSTAEKRPGMGEVVDRLKTVRKRAPAWNNLRRRVDRSGNVFLNYEESQEIPLRRVRGGSRRQCKVSNIASTEFQDRKSPSPAPAAAPPAPPPPQQPYRRSRVMRSKSVGLIGHARVGPAPNQGEEEKGRIRAEEEEMPTERKPRMTAAAVTLSKSRSTGIIRSRAKAKTRETDFPKSAIWSLDEKAERKLSESPLVYF